LVLPQNPAEKMSKESLMKHIILKIKNLLQFVYSFSKKVNYIKKLYKEPLWDWIFR
jgi:hypothetical protein